ncbi:MAG: hypothetical protein AB9903_36155 [Vulcanimicrobiota bacterium]
MDFMSNNPIFFRETRVFPMNRGMRFQSILHLLVYPLIFIVPFLFVSFTYLISEHWDNYLRDMKGILAGCFTFAVVIQFFYILGTSLATQTSLTKEKEMKTYEGLVASLMSSKEILTGKMMVCLYPILTALLIYSPLFVGMGMLAGFSFWGLLSVVLYSIGFSIFCGLIGIFASSVSSQSKKAQNVASAILAFLILATGFVDFIILITIHAAFPTAPSFPVLSFLNPGAGFASAMMSSVNQVNDMGAFRFFWIVNFLLLTLMGFAFWRNALKNVKRITDDDCSAFNNSVQLTK